MPATARCPATLAVSASRSREGEKPITLSAGCPVHEEPLIENGRKGRCRPCAHGRRNATLPRSFAELSGRAAASGKQLVEHHEADAGKVDNLGARPGPRQPVEPPNARCAGKYGNDQVRLSWTAARRKVTTFCSIFASSRAGMTRMPAWSGQLLRDTAMRKPIP